MPDFDFNEFLAKYRFPVLALVIGLVFVLAGVFITKSDIFAPQTQVEVLDSTDNQTSQSEVTVEIAGEVIKPGVYKLKDARVEDLLVESGGFSANADRVWTDKYLNRAAKLTDGQKVYIPKVGEQSSVMSANVKGVDQSGSSFILGQNTHLVNINTASLQELDSLPGIGPVYAQKVIDQRPYSTVEELLSKKAITKSVYEKIKDLVTVY